MSVNYRTDMLLTLAIDNDDVLMNIGTRVSTIMLTILECKSVSCSAHFEYLLVINRGHFVNPKVCQRIVEM
jgi:hypothetical protein